jgi:hypothetical protein
LKKYAARIAVATNPSEECWARTSSMIGLISQARAADAAPYTTMANMAPAMSTR